MSRNNGNGEPSTYQLIKYAILTILSETTEPMSADEISKATEFRPEDIVRRCLALSSYQDIRKVDVDGYVKFNIRQRGIDKLKYFNEVKHYGDYWKPPWEEWK
jgi:repressor of nif and glnA expression